MTNKTYKDKLRNRLLRFGVSVIKLAEQLPKTPAGFAVASQIIRSGTSIGANCEEAQDAFSRRDFLKGLTISLKEAKETCYWLEIIEQSNLLPVSTVAVSISECKEIVAILTSSVKTIRSSKI